VWWKEHNASNTAQMTQVTASTILLQKCLLCLVLHYSTKNSNKSQENEVQ
jgi:hypothetical protein